MTNSDIGAKNEFEEVEEIFRKYKIDQRYWTAKDFEGVHSERPKLKRVVFLGNTGAGKSTLMNVLAGLRGHVDKDTRKLVWQQQYYDKYTLNGKDSWRENYKTVQPFYPVGQGTMKSTTSRTEFGVHQWRGDDKKPFIAIDTPGYSDTSAEELTPEEKVKRLKELAADMNRKLLAVGYIHKIVILLPKGGTMLTFEILEMLRMIDEKFTESTENMWEHVIIAFSFCNKDEMLWRMNCEESKESIRKALTEKFPRLKEGDVNVPVLFLGGLDTHAATAPLRAEEPNHKKAKLVHADEDTTRFGDLWELIQDAAPLETTHLKLEKAAAAHLVQLMKDKEIAEAKAKAAIAYMKCLWKLVLVINFIVWRSAFTSMLPRFLRLIVLEFAGGWDEFIIVALAVYWIGLQDLWYAALHFYEHDFFPLCDKARKVIKYVAGTALAHVLPTWAWAKIFCTS